MKILIAGSWSWNYMEKAFADALSKIGHEVIPFAFRDFFHGKVGHYQEALPIPGPALIKLNRVLLRHTCVTNPDLVLVWNGTHVLPLTLRKIKETGAVLASYSNDDPFYIPLGDVAPWHRSYLWYWYLKCLKNYDINFVNKMINVKEAVALGANNVNVTKTYFIPDKDKPVEIPEAEKQLFACDVVFVGHYEPDGREEYLRALVQAGLHVRLFGGKNWSEGLRGDLANYFGDIRPVYGDEYSKALCGAKMCLAIFSTLNRDIYTRRCFEIPASGSLLLCKRTDEMTKMFVEGEEAVFFSSKDELVEKALWLVQHPLEIERIAEAGRKRVWADGHDVTSRARHFMDLVCRSTELGARFDCSAEPEALCE